jgi:hypothetical protein
MSRLIEADQGNVVLRSIVSAQRLFRLSGRLVVAGQAFD